VFYMVRPVTAFVAIGDVGSRAKREPPSSSWAGWQMATIKNLQMIPFLHRLDVVRAIPEWGWPRAPRRNTTVPPEYEETFLALLGSPIADTDGGVQENILREQRRLSRSRSRWLRDQAILASNGVCAACKKDYARLVPGRWPSVLHGHHLDPLSGSDAPVATDLSRMAAVCPTCHALIHLDPDSPLTPEQLAKQLAEGIVGP
jgi:hypothetical protein